jgi:septal ring factor EnvC (AmiA/AmiB activator)
MRPQAWRRFAGLVGLLVLAPVGALAASPEQAERAQMRAQLASARATQALLRGQQAGVLETLELAERLYRLSERRLERAEQEVAALERRRVLTSTLEQLASASLAAQLEALGPRLRLMDRRARRRPLDVVLSAQSFSSLVWRARALSTLVARDVAAIQRAERTRRFQKDMSLELATLKAAVEQRVAALHEQRSDEREQRAVLTDLLTLVQARSGDARRLVKELEQADRRLARFLAERAATPETSGFGALKGTLPWPAQGPISVGFGPVQNPQFNTVTEQKGVDLQAPAGAPVQAVADGRVVYSGWMRGYGNLLVLDHGSGYHTLVAHLSMLERKVGQQVAAGETLGKVGDTGSLKGAYLYFELRRQGEALDPADWLRRQGTAHQTE